MVRVRKRLMNSEIYYYLEHSQRKQGKVQKMERYLGKIIPKDIEKLTREFIIEIYEDKWFVTFEKIKKNYRLTKKTLPPSAIEKDTANFMTRFTHNTQRIEGSTLTLRETAILLEKDITPGNKPLADVKEAEAHKDLFYEMLGYEKDLSLQTVLYWHKLLFGSTKSDIAGKVRRHQVAISGSIFKPPMPVELEAQLRDFFRWYNKNKNNMHPVELAALVHLKFVTIHPFADGNGRMARVLMNFVLHRNAYPMFDIEYRKRNSYYNALERSQKKSDDSIFVQWIFRNYIKSNGGYLLKQQG